MDISLSTFLPCILKSGNPVHSYALEYGKEYEVEREPMAGDEQNGDNRQALGNEHVVEHKSLDYGTYVFIWLTLLILTATTATMAGVNAGKFNIMCVLLIACSKSSLVLAYFMHLKHESRLLRLMFFIAIATLTIFIGLTFVDYSFRW
jgi:cytochrome c oxidase subunit IV